MVERPVMMCGLEMEALTKRQEAQLEVGVSKVDKIANISAEHCRLSSLETRLEMQGCHGLDMCREGAVDLSNKDMVSF